MSELTLEALEEASKPSSNGRGRPLGVKNGQGTSVLAPIRNWKIIHESIVHLHMTGWSNERIALFVSQKMGKKISVTRISQVLQDPHAKLIIAETRKKMREKMGEDITGELTELAEESVKRLGETIHMQFMPGSDQKKHQDNVALALTKGFLPGNQEEGFQKESRVPVSLVSKLMDALTKTSDAERKQKEIRDAKEIVVDAPHEVLATV